VKRKRNPARSRASNLPALFRALCWDGALFLDRFRLAGRRVELSVLPHDSLDPDDADGRTATAVHDSTAKLKGEP